MGHKLIANRQLPHCPLLALCGHVYNEITECTEQPCDGFYWVHVSTQSWIDQVQNGVGMGQTVIVVSPQLALNELQQALQAGARGYCLESIPLDALVDLIHAVEQGGIWVPGGMLGSLVSLLSQHEAFSFFDETQLTLTDREKQVVNEVLTGASNLTIAKTLSITVSTVKDHMASIFRKLGVKDRVQLLLKLGQFQKLRR
ncbi:response regulator transcription factor [Alteromonas sp. 14N.309.X.WAT.G.H12]|uniref:response regulator transcription factor n=1 Tax=Alteromonas sp. 14N.309.X.WAT.G.H12 TaxID=3120824 RepID=UPI002FD3ABED